MQLGSLDDTEIILLFRDLKSFITNDLHPFPGVSPI